LDFATITAAGTKYKLLSVSDIAKLLGVGPETVRRYIREEKLRANKVRIRGIKEVWRVFERDLPAFAAAQNIYLSIKK
jgi:excisionase family DNA binding protein